MANDLSLNVLQPASPEWIAGRIETLLSHYFRPETNEMIEEAAMMDWIKALSGYSQDQIGKACDQYLRTEPRRRPTPGDIRMTIANSRGQSKEHSGKGDRSALTRDEATLLVEKILPAARRMAAIPELRVHGEKILEYWGETL